MANYFKDNLKYLRKEKGLSKNKLGQMAGVNQTTIGRWENGEISPTIDSVIDLMNALNISINELGNFLGKDLSKTKNQPSLSHSEEIKKALINKGVLNQNDDISESELEHLIDLAIANRDYLINKKD